ncbi:hypothetical protein LOK49_LG09G02058 [Camellia lanceoleosa]|uniref:Uncharacterized protein n=1 Tax=Camellia lanceoleosa TaxID=1840588 RepID=A0ACC0GJL5_9ERIC|nr:hypothetical protein LOK49_LG09G02058 [Camellia lanceoleosa]
MPPIYNCCAQTHKEHGGIQATGYHFLGSKLLANLRTRKQMTIMPWVWCCLQNSHQVDDIHRKQTSVVVMMMAVMVDIKDEDDVFSDAIDLFSLSK